MLVVEVGHLIRHHSLVELVVKVVVEMVVVDQIIHKRVQGAQRILEVVEED